MFALVLAAALTAVPPTDLLGLEACEAGTSLPPGWSLRPVSGSPAPDFSVEHSANGNVLKVEGQGAAAWAFRELERPLEPGNGRLSWSWRALESPSEADLSRPSGDDSPLRVYVVFGKPRPFGGTRAIFYSWGGREHESLTRAAFESKRIAVVSLAGREQIDGSWRSESVDPFRDYRRFWPGEPPPIEAVGVMQDTDATGQPARAEMRSLVWKPFPATTG